MAFPSEFWWGTGASSTQAEGAAPASDWCARAKRPGWCRRRGDGNGFGTRYAEDFALFAEHGLTHHRLSIEWARHRARGGRRDTAADRALPRGARRGARDAGISPWVCLHHFTLPGWFSDRRAAASSTSAAARYYWPRHVDFCAETFGDLVFGWKPINEPVALRRRRGWLGGSYPPHVDDRRRFTEVLESTAPRQLRRGPPAARRRPARSRRSTTCRRSTPPTPAPRPTRRRSSTTCSWRCWIACSRRRAERAGPRPVEVPASRAVRPRRLLVLHTRIGVDADGVVHAVPRGRPGRAAGLRAVERRTRRGAAPCWPRTVPAGRC